MDKVYFQPGDVVLVRQDISHKPLMLVRRKVTSVFKTGVASKDFLHGIECMWFDANQTLQIAIFNTKDLIKV